MIAFDRRLLANTADYFVTKATRVDILEVEDKMTQVLAGYSQQQTVGMGPDCTCDTRIHRNGSDECAQQSRAAQRRVQPWCRHRRSTQIKRNYNTARRA